MSTKTQVNAEEFALLGESFSIEEVQASFELVSAGTANVQAKVAQPTLPVNAELTAQVASLYGTGRTVKGTKSGRDKVVLGDQDGISPYRVIITRAKDAS